VPKPNIIIILTLTAVKTSNLKQQDYSRKITQRMRTKQVVACFKAPPQYLPGGTEKEKSG
jgi:hypothetical protein